MSLTTPAKRPTHHKKASGRHHRHSKHYLKTYYPYLPMLLLVIVGLAINIFWSSHSAVLGASTSINPDGLLSSTNTQRYAHHESSLVINADLNAAAQAKANDMVAHNYWSHNTPSGRTPWSFISEAGYNYQSAGENLAYGFSSANATITGWMNSPEHRANILNASYQDVGFGVASADNFNGAGHTTVIVAMYGEPAFPSATADTTHGNVPMYAASTTMPPLRSVARVQLLTDGSAPWSVGLLSIIALVAIAIIVLRHGFAWKRVLVESEEFLLHHKTLDFALLAIVVVGFVLTRSAGFIH